MNLAKTVYWIATGIMCAIFAFSAFNYFTQYDLISGFFQNLGFPTWLIYPLAIAKILGIVAILTRWSSLLSEWAYAGFFFDALLAFVSHQIAQDGASMFSVVALVSLVVSRYLQVKVFPNTSGTQAI